MAKRFITFRKIVNIFRFRKNLKISSKMNNKNLLWQLKVAENIPRREPTSLDC